jgi:transcription elongation factor Elf1
MKNIPEEITIQCPNCYELVYTLVSQIEEDRCLLCPFCFTSNQIDVDKLLENLEKLMEKVEEYKKKKEQ